MNLDTTNAAFEIVGSILIWRNVACLMADRQVKGVSLLVQLFMCCWGTWSGVYYGCLGHWWSLAGQVAMVAGNVTWLLLALAYRRRSA